jgi:hypothetical protein
MQLHAARAGVADAGTAKHAWIHCLMSLQDGCHRVTASDGVALAHVRWTYETADGARGTVIVDWRL